jgi:cytoskeleton protein RodZ
VSEDMSTEARDSGDYASFKPGQRLKKARELRGLGVDQVVAELRLSRRIVEGMESDDYSVLPEPAFVRGYMRRYAQLVKLSPDDIAARFDESYAADTATPEPDARPRNPIQLLGDIARPRLRMSRLLPWVSLAVISLFVAGFFWARQDDAPAPVETETVVPESAPVEAAVTPLPVMAPAAEVAPVNVLPAPAGPADLPAPVGAGVMPSATAPAAPLSSSPLPVAAGPDHLRVVLMADSWVSVTDASGKSLVSALRKRGETLALTGAAPFAVNVGNAAGVTMTINGKTVDLAPHTRGAVATLSVAR